MRETLSRRELSFLGACLTGAEPADAARAAGYAPARAEAVGRRLLQTPRIRDALSAAGRLPEPSLPRREDVTEERILRELCAIAFSDFTGFIRVEDGAAVVTDSRALRFDQKAAIAGIKDTGKGVEIKLHDKEKALELLVKYLGLFSREEDEDEGFRVVFDEAEEWSE